MRALQQLILSAALGCQAATIAWPSNTLAVEEPLAIVAPVGHHDQLGKDDIAAIFGRKKRFWSDGTRIEPINLPATDGRRRRFSRLIFGLMPEQMDAYWNEMYFNGVQPPFVETSPEAVLRYLSTTPGAIGYVPLCSSDSRVEILFVLDESGTLNRKPASGSCHP